VRWLRAIAAAGAVAYQLGWFALKGLRPDLNTLSAPAVALGLALPLGVAVFALAGATRRGLDGLGERASHLALLLVGLPALFVVGTVVTATRGQGDGAFWQGAVPCMLGTAMLTVGPLALGAWAFRHAFAGASAPRTAALGVACGALAAATMSLACPQGGSLHVVVGHGAAMIVGGGLGSLLGLRFTRS